MGHGNLLRKIKLYKNLLWFFFALNVFVLVSGGILGLDYWYSKKKWSDRQDKLFVSINLAHEVEAKLFALSHQEPVELKGKSLDKKTEGQLFGRFHQWQKLQEEIKELKSISGYGGLSLLQYDANGPKLAQVKKIYREVQELKKNQQGKIIAVKGILFDSTFALTMITLSTLLFGIIIPGFIFAFLTRALWRAQNELQKHVREWMNEWVKQSKAAGGEPFRNPQFWANMALLTVESFAAFSKHPIAHISGDLTYLIRQELQSVQEEAPHNPSKAA
jgi:hypothetical protein